MLYGTYEHQIDQKGRMRIPAKLRLDINSKDLVVCKGGQHCLYIYSREVLESVLAETAQVKLGSDDKDLMRIQRIFYGNIQPVTEDGQGRFTLSAALRTHARLDKEIIFVGMGNRIELWSKSEWEEYTFASDEEFDGLLAKLG